MQDVEGQKGRLAAAHLPDGEGQHQVVKQDSGARGPDQGAERGGSALGQAIGPNCEEHDRVAQGEKAGSTGKGAEVEPLDPYDVDGEESAGQDTGCRQETEPREEVEPLAQ